MGRKWSLNSPLGPVCLLTPLGAVSIRHPLFRQNQNGTRAVQISDTLLGGAQMISDTLLVGAQMSRVK